MSVVRGSGMSCAALDKQYVSLAQPADLAFYP